MNQILLLLSSVLEHHDQKRDSCLSMGPTLCYILLYYIVYNGNVYIYQ